MQGKDESKMIARRLNSAEVKPKKRRLRTEIWKNRYVYLVLLPFIVYYTIFEYVPLYGVQLAFKEFMPGSGIWGSPWIGLENFKRMFGEAGFLNALSNTIEISLINIFGGCLWPPLIAIMLSELRLKKCRRVLQTTLTIPHFLSWVMLSGILYNIFGSEGVVNHILSLFGLGKQRLLTEPSTFRLFLLITSQWKEAGWSSILYMAAIADIDPNLYEAAEIDGASRIKRIWHITVAHLAPIFSVNFIMAFGHLLNSNFEQIFNMYNSMLYGVADTIDTYVYRITFQQTPSYGFSVAVDFMLSATNAVLLFGFNFIQKSLGGKGMFEGGKRDAR